MSEGLEYINSRRVQLKNNKLYILGPFNEVISNEVIPELDLLVSDLTSLKNAEFEIIINSNGGYTMELFALLYYIDIMKKNQIKIITTVIGNADSCASMLAVCGDERYMYKYATQLVHMGTYPLYNINSTIENNRIHKNCDEHFKRIIDIYVNHTKLEKSKIDKLLTVDNLILNAEECLKYGFCDYII